MNIKTFFASVLIAGIGLACADQSNAQVTYTQGSLASGVIGWSSSAPLCQVLPGSAAISDNYSAPSSVSFAGGAFGTIGLICNVTGIANGEAFSVMNEVAYTFSNPVASSGCTASVNLVDRTIATPIYSWTSPPSTNFSGIWTVNVPSSTITSLNQGHTYDVEMYLTRSQSNQGTCNPIAYAAFLQHYL